MGQNCCATNQKIDNEMLLQTRKMVDRNEKNPTAKTRDTHSNLFMLSREQQMFQCKKVEAPVLLPQVEQTLNCKPEFNIPMKYEHGQFQDFFFRFYQTNIIYYGEWKNNAPNGFGTNYYPNGNYYEGLFVQGTPHGFGRLINSQGELYEGEVKYGRANGTGFYDNKVLIYRGDFKDNQKHGKGFQRSYDGVYYFQGTFEYDQKEEGLLRYGKVAYQGSFVDNLYHGDGKLTNEQGVYIGKFRNGKQHGYGQFLWADGSRYRGEFLEGLKEGQGEYYSAKDSTIARGYWKKNKLNGNGSYVDRFGEETRCIWQDSKIVQILEQ